MLDRGMKWMGVVCFLGALQFLSGCCNCQKEPVKQPPPPISLEDQVERLRAWSQALPRIHADITKVRFDFRDEEGHKQSVDAEGTLAIRQATATGEGTRGAPGGDVYLRGKAFDATAFVAGKNATDWWFIIYVGPKKDTAWRGDARKPVDLSTLNNPHSSSIFRADLVLDLLALSELPPTTVAGGNRTTVLMRVNDFDATNDLFVESLSPDGHIVLTREIIVDRFSGHVKEVRLYDAAGVLAVRSELTDYKPAMYGEDVSPPQNPPPAFPRRVIVSYPAQQSVISLQMGEVRIPATLADAAFRTPDFEAQHLKVIWAD